MKNDKKKPKNKYSLPVRIGAIIMILLMVIPTLLSGLVQ